MDYANHSVCRAVPSKSVVVLERLLNLAAILSFGVLISRACSFVSVNRLKHRLYGCPVYRPDLSLLSNPAPVSRLLALITKLKQLCNLDRESGESVKLEALKLILVRAVVVGRGAKLDVDFDVTALPKDVTMPRSIRYAALLHEDL